MYRCCDCCGDFYRPDEIEIVTPCEDYGVDSDFPNYTLVIVDICPFCKSEDIYEVDDVWDAEVR